MYVGDMTVCEKHQDAKLDCLYCDLVEENYWKDKYFQMLKQHMETVKELYELELKFKG